MNCLKRLLAPLTTRILFTKYDWRQSPQLNVVINTAASSADENKRTLRQIKKDYTNMVICIFTTITLVLLSQRPNSVQCNGKFGIICLFVCLFVFIFWCIIVFIY